MVARIEWALWWKNDFGVCVYELDRVELLGPFYVVLILLDTYVILQI